jgi:DNA (cytosine-5)-methyltransferase 1
VTARVLDLFCKAGGAGYGYHLVGYEVVGVDLEPQPNYPFEFHQADALTFPLDEFDLIHASPPCQAHSMAARLNDTEHPRLIEPTRRRLRASGIPYVIENVVGAPLIDPIMLCGAMFGLRTYRHRLFEASFTVPDPGHQEHVVRQAKMGRPPAPGEFIQVVGHTGDVEAARAAMGIWWMTSDELAQAIPPAYTVHIGAAAAASYRHDLPPEIVTAADAREAARRQQAAERARRYRARKSGKNIPKQQPGPKPQPVKVKLHHATMELAELRTQAAAYKTLLESQNHVTISGVRS